MKKIFIQSVFPAPYRTGVFEAMNNNMELFVCFERSEDYNRSPEWFKGNFNFEGVVLNTEEDIKKFKIEIKRLKKYDAVLAYDYSSIHCMKLMVKCLILRIPYYINCDGALDKKGEIWKDQVKRFFIKNAKGCFASGEHAEKYFLKFGAKKENIFKHNFTSLTKQDILLSPICKEEKLLIRKRLNLDINKKIVVSVGQFTYRKGYDVLIKAWKNIKSENCILYIIGGGEDKQKYISMIEEEGIENIVILDYKEKDEIFEYYKAADIFVLPTREDIWGLVINEAMACGLPIITTDKCVAGVELLEESYIISTEDSVILSEKIRTLLDNEEERKRLAINNLNRIKQYTMENVAKAHYEALNRK